MIFFQIQGFCASIRLSFITNTRVKMFLIRLLTKINNHKCDFHKQNRSWAPILIMVANSGNFKTFLNFTLLLLGIILEKVPY